MAWTPKLIAAENQNGKAHIVIQYSDGLGMTFNEDVNLTNPQTLNDVVAARIAQLTSLDTFYSTLSVGSNISTTPTPPPTPTPAVTQTQAQIDQNLWMSDHRLFNRWKTTLVDPSIITAVHPTYSAMLTSLQSRLTANPGYMNLV